MSEATTVAIKLLRDPVKLAVVWASAQAFSLRVLLMAPTDDGYGQSPEDPAYGYTGVGVSSGLGYRVRLYTGGELMQEQELAHTDGETSVAVEFSGLASDSRYEVVATPYNRAGEGPPFFPAGIYPSLAVRRGSLGIGRRFGRLGQRGRSLADCHAVPIAGHSLCPLQPTTGWQAILRQVHPGTGEPEKALRRSLIFPVPLMVPVIRFSI